MAKNIYIALDNVRSLENIGAIMRTCSFFGIKNLVLIGYSGTWVDFKGKRVLHPAIAKTALGAQNDLEIKIFETCAEFLEFIESKKIELISVEQDKRSVNLKDFKLWDLENYCFVFGNELEGVNKEIMDKSTTIVEIERLGSKNSLNVATSVGVVIYGIGKV
ncbi:TrmH family RNA methyltransferase [candidate division WWE3 bacterium]|nr:TrmH family RNA methyltransferase [candidate division WWE3 bacterium]